MDYDPDVGDEADGLDSLDYGESRYRGGGERPFDVGDEGEYYGTGGWGASAFFGGNGVDGDTPTDDALVSAVMSGDAERCRVLLRRGADPQARVNSSPRSATVLHIAAEGDDAAVVRALLDAGAEVDATATGKSTPLAAAAERRAMRALLALVEGGASCRPARDRLGRTPLHNARFPEVVDLLLSRDTDAGLEATDKLGYTPLLVQAKNGAFSSCELMIEEHDAEVKATGTDGKGLLHLALLADRPSSKVRRPPAGADEAHDGSVRNLVCCAVMYGCPSNATDGNGETPVHVAARRVHTQSLRSLLRSGGCPHALNHAMQSPLLLAAMAADAHDCVGALLAAGADPSVRSIDGVTPLHVACARANVPVVEDLCRHRADVFARQAGGATPLDLCTPGLVDSDTADPRNQTISLIECYVGARRAWEVLLLWASRRPEECGIPAAGPSRLRLLRELDEGTFRLLLSFVGDVSRLPPLWRIVGGSMLHDCGARCPSTKATPPLLLLRPAATAPAGAESNSADACVAGGTEGLANDGDTGVTRGVHGIERAMPRTAASSVAARGSGSPPTHFALDCFSSSPSVVTARSPDSVYGGPALSVSPVLCGAGAGSDSAASIPALEPACTSSNAAPVTKRVAQSATQPLAKRARVSED